MDGNYNILLYLSPDFYNLYRLHYEKVILALVASAFVSFAYAQDVNFDSFKRIESDKVLNLSADQIAKIKS